MSVSILELSKPEKKVAEFANQVVFANTTILVDPIAVRIEDVPSHIRAEIPVLTSTMKIEARGRDQHIDFLYRAFNRNMKAYFGKTVKVRRIPLHPGNTYFVVRAEGKTVGLLIPRKGFPRLIIMQDKT